MHVPLQDVMDNRDFLLGLLYKKGSYLTHGFIPSLLNILEENIKEKYPDTGSLMSVNMHLSSEGKARWEEAIQENIEFEPFRDFAQLRPYMTEMQKKRLDSILEQRTKNLRNQSDAANTKISVKTNPESSLTKSEEFAEKTLLSSFSIFQATTNGTHIMGKPDAQLNWGPQSS